jgi:hypothetical protein
MKHLILGHAQDAHAQHMLAALRARGHAAYWLQTDDFPARVTISMRPGQLGKGSGCLRLADGTQLDLDEIGSVYWRNFCGVGVETSKAQRGSQQDVAYYDCMASLRSWFALPNHTRWFNSWAAYQMHQEKPWQLHQVATAGILTPRTCISNDVEQVLAFCRDEPQVIFKPVYGGAHAEKITPAHLAPAHLARALGLAPITLQQYIAGTNIRTYAIGQQVFALELDSDQADFRTDANLKLRKVALPPEVEQQVLRIMRMLGLNFTAIDWRCTPDGQYYFLEANPSPMFLAVERQLELPLSDTLIAAMTDHESSMPVGQNELASPDGIG